MASGFRVRSHVSIPARDLRAGYILDSGHAIEIVDKTNPDRVAVAIEGQPLPIYFDLDELVIVKNSEDGY